MAIIDFPGPTAPNGYSNTVVVAPGSRFVYISGQVPIDADGKVPEGWTDQTRLTFRNVEAALAAGGAGLADVIKLTYFVTATEELPLVRSIRDEFVDVARPPASSLIQVAGLFRPDLLIEIEAVAAVPA